jgi:hypothetical protein
MTWPPTPAANSSHVGSGLLFSLVRAARRLPVRSPAYRHLPSANSQVKTHWLLGADALGHTPLRSDLRLHRPRLTVPATLQVRGMGVQLPFPSSPVNQ